MVIDSGNGGEYTLHFLRKECWNENFIFLKDIDNAPYGNKTKDLLLKITINNINKIKSQYDIKMIVFACNTLSTTILNEIKSYYKDLTVLGVKPLIKVKNNEKTLVLSTNSTLKLGHIDSKYEKNKNVIFIGFDDLAKRIDENLSNLDSLLPYLLDKLKNIGNVDNISLGCTHFNLIKSQLKQIFGNVKFYENSPFVARKMKYFLKKKNLNCKDIEKGRTIIITHLDYK